MKTLRANMRFRAIELLKQAIDTGLSPLANVRADPELEPLHSYPEYQALVQEYLD